MRKICIFFFALFLLLSTDIQAFNLSEQAKISLITCDPGKELYALFGHTAIRVFDPQTKTDEVFNYGVFDFSTPGFYLKFILGNLNYELLQTDFDGFYSEYVSEDRTVYEQEILLSHQQLQLIYDSLQLNYLPENRYYHYDFFRDNCSTRALNTLLAFADNQEIKKSLEDTTKQSFRQALKPFLASRPWISTGINFMLGPFSDKKMTRKQSSFLPNLLMDEIEKTGLAGQPLVLYQGTIPERQTNDFSWPLTIFWIMAFLLIAEALGIKTTQKVSDTIDLILFTVSGVMGLLLLFLWIFSFHISLRYNLNILWANPLLLLMLWAIPRNKKKFIKVILLVYGLLMFFLLINWNRMPQKFPMEMMPVVTFLAFRTFNRVFQFRKKTDNKKIINFQ